MTWLQKYTIYNNLNVIILIEKDKFESNDRPKTQVVKGTFLKCNTT